MSGRRFRLEYAVVAAVIVVAVVAVALRSGNRLSYKVPSLAKVEGDDVTRLTVEGASGTLDVEKRDGTWRILPEGWVADPSLVTPMVSAVAGLELTALVSEAQSYPRYELDEGGRLRVTLFAGGSAVRRLDVGKEDETGRSSFVLLPEDKRIWSSRQNLRSLLGKDKAALRDMTVLSFSQEDIVKVTAKSGSRTVALRKLTEQTADKQTVATWKTEAGVAWDQERVAQLLRVLARLRCQRYGEKGESVGKETLSVFLEAQDGTGYSVSFHDKVGSQVPGLSSMSDYPFYVADYQYQDVAEVLVEPAAAD